jgi:hypothetical protein
VNQDEVTMIEQGHDTIQPHLVSRAVEPHLVDRASHDHERVHAGVTMALYISLSLLAVMVAQEASLDPLVSGSHAMVIVLTSVGLILAHRLAFQLSTRLVHRGQVSPASVELLGGQLIGGLAITVVAVTPVLLFDGPGGLLAAELLLLAFIAGVGYVAARSVPLSRPRALAYVAIVVVLALVVLWVKGLVHH